MIRTEYNPKPIPMRQFDWDAWDINDETIMGHGRTKYEALKDLMNQREDKQNDNKDTD